MKSVLISIRPQWCEKILHEIGIQNGKTIYEKTLDVRKTRPNIPTPFKCYIYQTKESKRRFIDHRYNSCLRGESYFFDMGKVICEFVCDEITNLFADSRFWLNEELVKQSCLTSDEIRTYGVDSDAVYGWHISDLQIYDEPRELSKFFHDCGENPECEGCEYYYMESNESIGFYDQCCSPLENFKPITRAPQSWQYVEYLRRNEE